MNNTRKITKDQHSEIIKGDILAHGLPIYFLEIFMYVCISKLEPEYSSYTLSTYASPSQFSLLHRKLFFKNNVDFPIYINQLENKIKENNPFKVAIEIILAEAILLRIFMHFNNPDKTQRGFYFE